MGYVIAGAGVVGLAAVMAHGDEDSRSWFRGTLKMLVVLLIFAAVVVLFAYLDSRPGHSFMSQFN